jgi:predicted house-cleaning noncanonical NTP pyrophosphatase (MazG superfamily)
MKYNKLVRNRIPHLIASKGDKPITRILSFEEYIGELKRKLNEEVTEYEKSGGVEELADILEVVYSLATCEGYSSAKLEEIRQQKRNRIGGFEEKIFLIETI